MLGLFFSYQIRKLGRYFQTKQLAKTITVGLFFLVFFAIALGVYLFTSEGLSYVTRDAFLKEAIALYIYEIYLLIIMFLVFFILSYLLLRKKTDE